MFTDYMQVHVPAVPAAFAAQTQSTLPNVQVLFATPPLAGVQALFATGVAVGQAIGVTQLQTCATPVAAFWHVHCAGPKVQRLAWLPPITALHIAPFAGSEAGQTSGPAARQLQAAGPVAPARHVHWLVPIVQRFALLPPATNVHAAPVAGAAAGHMMGPGGKQLQTCPMPLAAS